MQKKVRFEVTYTDSGVTVRHFTVGSDRPPGIKMFRKGYAGLSSKVDNWIHERINSYREFVVTEDVPMPDIEVVGHVLSKRLARRSELETTIRSLIEFIEEHHDAGDINSEAGKLCELAEDILRR